MRTIQFSQRYIWLLLTLLVINFQLKAQTCATITPSTATTVIPNAVTLTGAPVTPGTYNYQWEVEVTPGYWSALAAYSTTYTVSPTTTSAQTYRFALYTTGNVFICYSNPTYTVAKYAISVSTPSYTVNNGHTLTLTAVPSPSMPNGGGVTGYQYQWQKKSGSTYNNIGTLSSTATTYTLTGALATDPTPTYRVLLYDNATPTANLIATSSDVNITVLYDASVSASSYTACLGSTLTLSTGTISPAATSPVTSFNAEWYESQDGGVTYNLLGTTAIYTTSGTYAFTVGGAGGTYKYAMELYDQFMNPLNTFYMSSSVTVPHPTASISVCPRTFCYNTASNPGTQTFNGNTCSGCTYAWSGSGSGTLHTYTTTSSYSTTSPTSASFIYKVTDVNGCSAYDTANILSHLCNNCDANAVLNAQAGGCVNYTLIGSSGPSSQYKVTNGSWFFSSPTGTVTLSGSNMNFTNANILVDAGTTIQVGSSTQFASTGSTYFSCSGMMWSGIINNNSLPLTFMNNNIADADTAVVLTNDTGASKITSNLFNKNTVGLSIWQSPETSATATFVSSNIFTCRDLSAGTATWPWAAWGGGGPYVPPFNVANGSTWPSVNCNSGNPASTGIRLSNTGTTSGSAPSYTYQELLIQGVPGLENVFDNLHYGIYAVNSNFTSSSNIFMYMNYSSGTDGTGIYSTADPYYYKVRAQVTGTSPANNKFYAIDHDGVNLNNNYTTYCSDVVMVGNRDASTTPPACTNKAFNISSWWFGSIDADNSSITNMTDGIYITEADNGGHQIDGAVYVTNNTMSAVPSGSTFSSSSGGYINNAVTFNNTLAGGTPTSTTGTIKISDNNISDVYQGIHVSWCSPQTEETKNNTISIQDNGGSGPFYGILHENNALNDIVDNTISLGSGSSVTANSMGIHRSHESVTCRTLCNSTTDLGTHIKFDHIPNPTTWNDNVMNNGGYAETGLLIVGLTTGIGTQGNPTTVSTNEWAGTWTSSGSYATYLASYASATSSKLYVSSYSGFDPTAFANGNDGSTSSYSTSNGIDNTYSSSMPSTSCPAAKHAHAASNVMSIANKGQQQYTVSPNPGDGNMRLMQLRADEKPVQIEVLDARGELVYKGQIQFSTLSTGLNLAGILSPGLYMLHLRDSDGRNFALKFVKE